MKYLLSFILVLLSSAGHTSQALDIAIETGGIRVEYIPSSQRGIVRVYRCAQCSQSYYKFSTPPIIIKRGEKISFNEFLKDYWNAKFPTLILDKESLNISKVVY